VRKTGETVKFNIFVTPNETWASADGKDKHIILRVIIEQETNRPDHHKSKMTINISPCEEVEPSLEPVPEETPTPVPVPRVTPDFCNSDLIHPTGIRLAGRYNVLYDEIMIWFCNGFGFGEIDLAYSLAEQTEIQVKDIFEMKEPGKAWGQIKKELQEKVKPTPKPIPPGLDKTPKPDKDMPDIPTKKPANTRKP
jgi:hypothetical protein